MDNNAVQEKNSIKRFAWAHLEVFPMTGVANRISRHGPKERIIGNGRDERFFFVWAH